MTNPAQIISFEKCYGFIEPASLRIHSKAAIKRSSFAYNEGNGILHLYLNDDNALIPFLETKNVLNIHRAIKKAYPDLDVHQLMLNITIELP